MLRSALALCLAGLLAGPAVAADVTLTYRGVVTYASGPHADAFVRGQAITVRYVVDSDAPDENPDASAGLFRNGLRELRIAVPAAGVDVVAGPGTVQTFDNANGGRSDQVFFYGMASAGQLAGRRVTNAEVDFIEDVDGLSGPPLMLRSDALPTGALVAPRSYAMIYTDAGYTFVNFVAEADTAPTVAELVVDGRILIGQLRDAGRLRSGHASAFDSKLADVLAAFNAGNTALACDAVQSMRNQARALATARQISAATAAELRGIADALGQTIGC